MQTDTGELRCLKEIKTDPQQIRFPHMKQLRACQCSQIQTEHHVTKTSQTCRKKKLLEVGRMLKDKKNITH